MGESEPNAVAPSFWPRKMGKKLSPMGTTWSAKVRFRLRKSSIIKQLPVPNNIAALMMINRAAKMDERALG